MRFVPQPCSSAWDRRALFSLSFLGLILGYAVLQEGATGNRDWLACQLAVGSVTLLFWCGDPRRKLAAGLKPRLLWTLVLLLAVSIVQVVPLPQVVVEAVSPTRADLHRDLRSAVAVGDYVTFSVAPSATLFQIMRLATGITVLLLTFAMTCRLGHGRWLAVVPIVAVATFQACLGIVQYLSTKSPEGATGTYVNHNHFCGLLEMALPFAVAYGISAIRRVRLSSSPSISVTIAACLSVGISGILILGVICSLSRAGLVAMLLSLLAMAFVSLYREAALVRNLLALGLLVALLLGAVVVLAPPDLVMRYALLDRMEGFKREGRVLLWSETLDLIRDYPLVGTGLGTYESAFLAYKVSWPHVTDDYAHNDYLQSLAEFGIAGSILAALTIAIPLRVALQRARRDANTETGLAALGCVGSITAMLLHSLVDFNFHIPANGMVFAWILGFCMGLGASVESDHLSNSFRSDSRLRLRTQPA